LGAIRGGVQERARQMACCSVGKLNARSDLDASITLLLSSAFWFVCKVATHYSKGEALLEQSSATICHYVHIYMRKYIYTDAHECK
jgi:hypothetical protein